MYNEEIKQRFVESADNTFTLNRGRKWVFDAVSKHEEAIGKDAAEMNPSEAIKAIECSGIEELASARQIITTMKTYTEWCARNQIFESIPYGFLQINVDDIDFSQTFREVLYKDDEALITDLRSVGDFDSGYIDVLVFVFSWLGLDRKEMVALRDKDVDLEKRVISNPDGLVLASGFSDSITDVLERYRKCQVSTRLRRTTLFEVRKDNSVDSFFKKMCSVNSKRFGQEYKVKHLENESSRLAKRFAEAGGNPNRLTINNVYRSGCLYRLWQMEQETGLDMGNMKRREYIDRAFRNRKNYTNAARMYRWYKKVFWE